ncbi:monoacylglycerol lipase ABHD2 isoform X1 [Patella vulgata]|uniref:monoacylglycerol lipase ABHD2 isoform X1 n=2 Tax=Patella vulgata TaxID=6465 RepID=UPI00217F351B|nr:monoacylglycerol lipase ABHD2 isoform X1 [Patella vulgata]
MSLTVALTGFVCICFYGIVKFLNLASTCSLPDLYAKDKTSTFVSTILASCPILMEAYMPPLLWGKSGHLQTIIYAKMGRVKSPLPQGERIEKIMADQATMSFDVFQPQSVHPTEKDFTLAVCPGIANSSESLYIRTLVDHAQKNGYRVAVLNHLGALRYVRLTAPRIFNYGETGEYNSMIDEIIRLYPNTTIIAVGCSMGANIVLKYLGEDKSHEKKVIGALSLCQGYDANDAKPLLLSWESGRRMYSYFMAVNLRNLIKHHKDILLGKEAIARYGPFDEDAIYASSSLLDIDVSYSLKTAEFRNYQEYYHWASCKQYLKGIEIPLIILNAKDDPIVPPVLYETAKKYVESRDNCIFLTTDHGGHLGYFEGGILTPNTITWLDRAVVEFSHALCQIHLKNHI